MNLHRAQLRSRNMEVDGRSVEVLNSSCVVGSPWIADLSYKVPPQRMWCGDAKRWIEDIPVIYVMHDDDSGDEGGILPACLFDIDEVPI